MWVKFFSKMFSCFFKEKLFGFFRERGFTIFCGFFFNNKVFCLLSLGFDKILLF